MSIYNLTIPSNIKGRSLGGGGGCSDLSNRV